MKARFFMTGSCSSALGNWEQQLGNAAILIGLSRSIHQYMPDANITTKYQLSEEFSKAYQITPIRIEPVSGAKLRRTVALLNNLLSSAVWRFLRRVFGTIHSRCMGNSRCIP